MSYYRCQAKGKTHSLSHQKHSSTHWKYTAITFSNSLGVFYNEILERKKKQIVSRSHSIRYMLREDILSRQHPWMKGSPVQKGKSCYFPIDWLDAYSSLVGCLVGWLNGCLTGLFVVDYLDAWVSLSSARRIHHLKCQWSMYLLVMTKELGIPGLR